MLFYWMIMYQSFHYRVLTDGAKSAGGSIDTAPFRHWSHDNAITDIHVGLGGAGCWVYSASQDKSVKVGFVFFKASSRIM